MRRAWCANRDKQKQMFRDRPQLQPKIRQIMFLMLLFRFSILLGWCAATHRSSTRFGFQIPTWTKPALACCRFSSIQKLRNEKPRNKATMLFLAAARPLRLAPPSRTRDPRLPGRFPVAFPASSPIPNQKGMNHDSGSQLPASHGSVMLSSHHTGMGT